MNVLQQACLRAYTWTTRSARRRLTASLRDRQSAPVCGLFYHRVADTTPNGWTIGADAFRRQIEWLAERFDIVSLAEARRRLVVHHNPRPAVVITFDDGYADNGDAAIPLLLERRLPFTYFVTTDHVRNQAAFPHDVAAGAPLQPNTIAQLRELADAGVELGAHTLSHADLGDCPPVRLRNEIVGSIDQLQQWTGRKVESFAFPFGLPGNMTPAGMRIAREAGCSTVCSAYGAYNLPGSVAEHAGLLHFRRIHADPEWARFENWMTFDPRKLHAVDPIDDGVWLGDGADAAPAPLAASVAG